MADSQLLTLFAPAERADLETVRRQSAYFFSEALLPTFASSIPDVLLILNSDRQIVFANAATLRLLSLNEQGELLGLRPGEALHCIHACEMDGGCGTTEFCHTCGAAKTIVASLNGLAHTDECRISLADGESLDLRVWGTPMEVHGEKFIAFILVDISSEKRRQVLERIFFHDILNTAGGMRGYASLLIDASPEELDEYKVTLYQLADQLIEEIQAQRQLAAAESHELVPHLELVHPLILLAEVVETYRNHDVALGKQISILESPDCGEILTDRMLLRRVLSNLLKNALEASPRGQTILLGYHLRDSGIEFFVHNVTFMPRDVQLQMFQRSFSTKGRGRGVGSYSIKLLTEHYLSGKVTFTTTETEGTTFFAWLPLGLES
jgi:signal transduction histidine kinase